MKNIKLIIFLFFLGISSIFAQQKKYITYTVLEGETIQSIAKKLSETPYNLLKLNPDIDKDVKTNDLIIIPNKNYDPLLDNDKVDLSPITLKDIVVDNYIYHEVWNKETLYSIQQKYKVSNAELNKLNPFLLNEVLKQGHVLKIPLLINEVEISSKEKNTQPYLVKPKETKYSIARNFGISITYLEELNPKIKKDGLQIDDVIIVPKEKSIENSDAAFTVHKVEKLETLYSLSNEFQISQEELLNANPLLIEGVKEGMLIKIPNRSEENNEAFADEVLEDIKLRIAMMLPFQTKRDSLNFEDRLFNITTDFYFGALLAIDSLKNQGLSVHMKVYDTENSKYVSNKLSNKSEFEGFDVVIGPMFLKNVKAVSENLQFNKALIVSPISSKDHSKINNINLVQEVPTKEQLALEMLQYIKSSYSNQKLVIITEEVDKPNTNYKVLIKEIKALDTLQEITIIKPEKGYIKLDVFKKAIDENRENWILLIGNDKVLVADVVNNLGVLPVENKITLFAFQKGKNFDKIDNNFLARVNFYYPTSTYLNVESQEFIYFKNKYKKTYYTYPSKYAIEGFDITYDILMRLATNSDLINQGTSQRLATKYNFIENTSGSIINQGVFIIRYDGLELKVVK